MPEPIYKQHREKAICAAKNLFDKPAQMLFPSVVEMNSTFATKTLKHTPVIGCMANWQRDSRPLGIVGAKF
jgi:hypothetical protein